MSGDDGVIQRAKAGDAAAWRELYRAHAGRLVVWLGTRPSGDSAITPDDVAAEAWLTAARKIPEFTGTADEFAGWLFGIARNLSTNTRRRSGRRLTTPTAFDGNEHGGLVDGPEPELVARDLVTRTLAVLSPRERDVVACLDVVGLDVEATARALSISPVAVRVAHHRGLRRLRRLTPPQDGRGEAQPSAASSRSR